MEKDNVKTQNTITNPDAIIKALGFPKNMPNSFLRNYPSLVPIGEAKYKGDSMPEDWSCNNQFTIGQYYPIYESEDGYFPIGTDGAGKKMLPKAWSKIKYFKTLI